MASCLRGLSTDQGPKLLEEREKIHSSNHDLRPRYSPHLRIDTKGFLEKWWASVGLSLKERKGAGPKVNVVEVKREQFCKKKAP